MTEAFFRLQDVNVKFGGLHAVQDLSLSAEAGQIHALIGPNGAGKSTILNCVSRFYVPDSGSIEFEGRSLLDQPSWAIPGLGIGRTFQNIELCMQMTVLENVLVGMTPVIPSYSPFFPSRKRRRIEAQAVSDAETLLDGFGLLAERDNLASSLDYGRQKLLDLARALASKPRLLLLDEPAAGLRNQDIEAFKTLLRQMARERHITIILIEHVMQLVMGVADKITVLNFGRKIAEGAPAEIRAVHALEDISLRVEGRIVCLLGANGAGKSTTLNCISGIVPPKAGRITFEGDDITGLSPDRIVARGIIQVPEGREIFATLSVRDNLQLGAYLRSDKAGVADDLERVLDYFPPLLDRLGQRAGTLSGGEQQMLAIGRALMSRPKLLMMDEPSLGLSPVLVDSLFEIIARVQQTGVPILLVEQNASVALAVSDFGYILENGEMILNGESKVLQNNEAVKEAYLGL